MNNIENEIFLGITISFENEILNIKGSFNNNIKEIEVGKIFKINKNNSIYGILLSSNIFNILSEEIFIDNEYEYNQENNTEYKYLTKTIFHGICIKNNFVLNLYEPVYIINKVDYLNFFNQNFIQNLIKYNLKREDFIKIFSNIINLYFEKNYSFIQEFLNLLFIELNRDFDIVKNISKNIY